MANPIQFKRGLSANRTSVTPAVAEPIVTTDTKKVYIGDGSTAGGLGLVMDSEVSATSAAGKIVKADGTGKIDSSFLHPATDVGAAFLAHRYVIMATNAAGTSAITSSQHYADQGYTPAAGDFAMGLLPVSLDFVGVETLFTPSLIRFDGSVWSVVENDDAYLLVFPTFIGHRVATGFEQLVDSVQVKGQIDSKFGEVGVYMVAFDPVSKDPIRTNLTFAAQNYTPVDGDYALVESTIQPDFDIVDGTPGAGSLIQYLDGLGWVTAIDYAATGSQPLAFASKTPYFYSGSGWGGIQPAGSYVKSSDVVIVSSGAADSGKIPSLDASGRLDASTLPTSVTTGGMVYKGTVDASAADPAAAGVVGTPQNGWLYRVTVAGSSAFSQSLKIGDYVVYNGATWDKIDSTDPVVSGTSNRVTVSGDATAGYTVDIAATYVGQTSLTTVGTVTTGTWNATPIADAYVASAATWNAKLDGSSTIDGGSF